MQKSIHALFLILLCHSLGAQTWSKKLDFAINYPYLHSDSVVGVKDADVLLNGNICALAQVNQDESTKLFVIDPLSQQILWTEDLGAWWTISSQFTKAITTTSDTSILVCTNRYSSSFNLVSGWVYKYSSTGNILWVDTFFANVAGQTMTAVDVIEANNGNYLALVGDTLFELNASNGIIIQSIPALGGSQALHRVPGSTDFIVNGYSTTARFAMNGSIVWSFNHSTQQYNMQSAITTNAFYLLLNDSLHIINFTNGSITNSVQLPPSLYSSLNAAANGDLLASQGEQVYGFNWAVPDSGGIVRISPSGNILLVKSIPLPLFGVSWVSELPGGMLFCGGTYKLTRVDPNFNILSTDYMPFCFTTDQNGNGIMDSTTYMWPGDANHNHILQFSDDAIYIQQSFGITGTSRDTINYFPIFDGLDYSDFHADWSTINSAGVNDKFCDVNGDGIIGASDLNAFSYFWYSSPVNVIYRLSQIPDVTFVPVSTVFATGDTAAFYIIAGHTTPLDSVTGIAFSNVGYLNVNYQSVDFLPNNLGIPSVETRTFCSQPYNMNYANVVLSRIDRMNRHLSNDTIGIIKFIIPANYSDTTFSTSVTEIKAINGDGIDVPVVAVNGTVTITNATGIHELAGHEINLFPNPATDKIEIGSQYAQQNAGIYNSNGKCVMSISIPQNGSIDISALSEGIYFLKLIPGSSYRRFVVCR